MKIQNLDGAGPSSRVACFGAGLDLRSCRVASYQRKCCCLLSNVAKSTDSRVPDISNQDRNDFDEALQRSTGPWPYFACLPILE